MKLKYKFLLSLIVIQLICTNQGTFAETIKFIEQNGVSLADINLPEVEGKIHLSGSTWKRLIKVMIEKDNLQRWFELPLADGKFDKTIWLIDGKGSYRISIMVNEEGRLYSFGPQIKVENIVEVNRFLVPTKDIESDNPEIIKFA